MNRSNSKTVRMERAGIIAGGNWIIDHVKMIDVYPGQDALANILGESLSNGGAPYNVLMDLALLKAPFPLEAIGLVGHDSDGALILADCARHKIDTCQLKKCTASTSYTDVMTVRSTGRRTFFHQRGANAWLDDEHFDFTRTRARLFHLGYLLLLDRLDRPCRRYGTVAARVLARARQQGLKTSVDVVSEDSQRFRRVVLPALPHTDYCFLNEFETERSTGIELRRRGKVIAKRLPEAARLLMKAGVREWVIIHYPEAVFALHRSGESHHQGSVAWPRNRTAGTVGAGDAFAAGVLLGLHEGTRIGEALRQGVCAAAASLSHTSCSAGVRSLRACLAWGAKYGYRKAV